MAEEPRSPLAAGEGESEGVRWAPAEEPSLEGPAWRLYPWWKAMCEVVVMLEVKVVARGSMSSRRRGHVMSIEQYQHFVYIIQGPFMASLQASYYIHMLSLDGMLKLGLPI